MQDVRSFDLTEGLNTLDFTDVAASIDSTSVVFKSLTNPDQVLVLEQNFVFDLVGSGALLARYLDETISITTEDGTQFSGQLLSGRGGEIILRDADGQVFVVNISKVRDMQFPDLPDGLITRPTLRWLLQSGVTGAQNVELTYLTGGINWTADYNVLLDSGNTALDHQRLGDADQYQRRRLRRCPGQAGSGRCQPLARPGSARVARGSAGDGAGCPRTGFGRGAA